MQRTTGDYEANGGQTTVTTTRGPIAFPRLARLVPLGREAVTLRDGLLSDWSVRNRRSTIPHGIAMLAASGVLDNFKRLVGESDAAFRGPRFVDSDLYKTLEAVAWELGRAEDQALRSFFDDAVVLLERAQREDGYLNSAFQRADGEQEPWSDFVHGHELYCLGHLVQAAVAERRAMGGNRLLGIATRFVDLVIDKFGMPESNIYDGHPQIETALVELYRLTGDRRHLDLAAAFIDRRGSGFIGDGIFGPQYYQDDRPVRDTEFMRGHAVRALYLNTGATDLYLETGDPSLLNAMNKQWDDLVTRRIYITGGTGSRHRDEAFGDGYELPSDRAYAETCAGIALMQWAWRMYLATGQTCYLDTFELTLYNTFAAGTSDSGTAFFYTNPLQRRGDHAATQEEASGVRQPWFYCACCPPNIMRMFASIENYLGASVVDHDELQLGIYTAAQFDTTLAGGAVVRLVVDTDYPSQGLIRVTVVRGAAADAVLSMRVPDWCDEFHARVNGVEVAVTAEGGWLRLPGALVTRTEVELDLIMESVFVSGHPRADSIRGSVAITRGPVVYCIDQADNSADVDSVELLVDTPIEVAVGSACRTRLGPGLAAAAQERLGVESIPLYEHLDRRVDPTVASVSVVLRPYATWGNAGVTGQMRVWIPHTRSISTKEASQR